MNQQQQQSPPALVSMDGAKKAGNILYLAARTIAAPVEVMLRRGFGKRYFGMPTFLALLGLPMWVLFWQREDPRPMLWFWFLFIVMQLRARWEQRRRKASSDRVHSRYNGSPILSRIFRHSSENKIKATIEPLVVFIAGLLLFAVSPPLGSYLVTAAFCLGLTHGVLEAAEEARAVELHDALIEQQQLAERFNALRSDRAV